MSNDINDTSLASLLSSSIAGDSNVDAMAQAVQPEIDDVTGLIPTIEIYRLIDQLPEPLLRMLAWENRMDGAEWVMAVTLDDKRNLVKNSFELNKRRGTLWSVKRIFEVLRLTATVKEWWEPGEAGVPGTFRISILDVSGRGIMENELALVGELITAYKPLSRHNTGINLMVQAEATVYAGAAITMSGVVECRGVPLVLDGTWLLDGSQEVDGVRNGV